MSTQEFNEKWASHLETGHYGLAINSVSVISFLDEMFTDEVARNPDFSYSQIKLKFGYPVMYTNSPNDVYWTECIKKLLHREEMIGFLFSFRDREISLEDILLKLDLDYEFITSRNNSGIK